MEPKAAALTLGMVMLIRALWVPVSRGPWQGQGRAMTSAESLPVAEQTVILKTCVPRWQHFMF